MNQTPPPSDHIISVSELNRQARSLLEASLGRVWVEGELSNFKTYSSGHWYFTLKDENAQISCAMFSRSNRAIRFVPRDGMHLIISGKVSLYEARGNYQLIAEQMIDAGEGLLKQRFDALKAQLEKEGLFDPAHKKPLPVFPRHIGIITSPSGAAIRDILSTFARRFPALRVTLIPAAVQGAEAAPQLVAALKLAQQLDDLDALIIGRGGGSLEDLWPFNEESVAHALFACPIPTVSAVGHEIDFAITDFVADQRAATPTAAAELLSPDQFKLTQQLLAGERQLQQLMLRKIQGYQQHLDLTGKRLIPPQARLQRIEERLNNLQNRLNQQQYSQLRLLKMRLTGLAAALQARHPAKQLGLINVNLQRLQQQLHQSMSRQLKNLHQRLAYRAAQLNTLSPLQTLARGFSIITTADGKLVRRYRQVQPKQLLHHRVADGTIQSEVIQAQPHEQP